MIEFIERVLHQGVQVDQYNEPQKLPLALRGSYRLQRATIDGQECLLAEPLAKTGLANLRKQHIQLEHCTGMQCVLCLRSMTYYARDALVEEGVPFVWEGRQVYLPFVGVLLDGRAGRAKVAPRRISFLTQRMLLGAVYGRWAGATVTRAAAELGVTKTSASRCFDELEALGAEGLSFRGRSRTFSVPGDGREAWESVRPYLRDPVLAEFPLRRIPGAKLPLSGLSALAGYSMLAEPAAPVLAVSKAGLPALGIARNDLAPADGEAACVVQELGCWVALDGGSVDPLTVALIVEGQAAGDPRVDRAVEEMLEEHVW